MSAPDSVVAQMATVPYIAPAGIHELGGTDAQRRSGARIDYFYLRSEPGIGGTGRSCESIGPIHRRHYGDHQQFDTSAALCIPAADQRAASFESHGWHVYVRSPEHRTTRDFRNFDRRSQCPRPVLLRDRVDGLCDGVPRGWVHGHHHQSCGWQAKPSRFSAPDLALTRRPCSMGSSRQIRRRR